MEKLFISLAIGVLLISVLGVLIWKAKRKNKSKHQDTYPMW